MHQIIYLLPQTMEACLYHSGKTDFFFLPWLKSKYMNPIYETSGSYLDVQPYGLQTALFCFKSVPPDGIHSLGHL